MGEKELRGRYSNRKKERKTDTETERERKRKLKTERQIVAGWTSFIRAKSYKNVLSS